MQHKIERPSSILVLVVVDGADVHIVENGAQVDLLVADVQRRRGPLEHREATELGSDREPDQGERATAWEPQWMRLDAAAEAPSDDPRRCDVCGAEAPWLRPSVCAPRGTPCRRMRLCEVHYGALFGITTPAAETDVYVDPDFPTERIELEHDAPRRRVHEVVAIDGVPVATYPLLPPQPACVCGHPMGEHVQSSARSTSARPRYCTRVGCTCMNARPRE